MARSDTLQTVKCGAGHVTYLPARLVKTVTDCPHVRGRLQAWDEVEELAMRGKQCGQLLKKARGR